MPRKLPKSSPPTKPTQVFGSNGLTYRFPSGSDGPIQISVDFSKIAPPAAYFYADCVRIDVDNQNRMATLVFGHRAESGDRLADRVEIVMPFNALFGTFWQSVKPIEQTVDKLLEGFGEIHEAPTIARGATERTKPAPPLFANVVFVATAEGETSLDFYHLAPREVHLAKTQRTDMNLQTTVRVIASTLLTKQLFNLIRPLAEPSAAGQVTSERKQSATGVRR
jgi:hypothetical protein